MKTLAAFFLFGLAASASAAGGRSLQSDDLLSEAQTILGQAAGSVEAGLHALVNGLFGPDNTFATKIPDDISNLSWDSLQDLGFSDPIGNLVSSIKNKTLLHDVLVAEEKITAFIDEFCTGPSYTPSTKVPSNCVGKQMVVKLAPWACSLYENKTIACNPPYIEVIKQPAECTAKHDSAAVFTGRQCRLIKNIGERLSKTIGGEAFSIDISKNIIDIPQGIASSLLPGQFDSSSAISTSGSISASASVAAGTGATASASSSAATAGRH